MIKRIVLFLISVIVFSNAGAQENSGGGIDDETLHFGFNFQFVNSEYKIFKKSNWRDPFYEYTDPTDLSKRELVKDSLYSIGSRVSPGFGFGFVSDLRLGSNLNLRFTPSLIFVDRLLDYEYLRPDDTKNQIVQSAVFDIPLGFKFKSDRRKNFRAYVLGGGKYSMDISSKKKSNDEGFILAEKFVKNKRNILWYEVGVGFDFYFEYFKMSPELKISNSIGDVLRHENHPYAAPIDKLFLHNIHFSLFFE